MQTMTEQKSAPLLPEEFERRMQRLLGEDFSDFLASYDRPRTYGLRVNTSRISLEEFEKLVPFPVRRIPWISNGYFYDEDVRPSRCPLYQAGLYYLQDPGAMTPGSRLPVRPGDRVLDLCAAPGGKACAAADRLKGEGLLVANDISTSRAKILLRNLEMCGTVNAFVTNETPGRLRDQYPGFFDRILLDAPCSGEGMFRKDEALLKDWSPGKSDELSRIQKDLLTAAADMLSPGGTLLYSTCTFSREENEESILHLLTVRPDMHLVPLEWYEGFAPGVLPDTPSPEAVSLSLCARIYPHRMDGEGQFLALLQKEGGARFVPEKEDAAASVPSLFCPPETVSSGRNKKGGRKKNASVSGPDPRALSLVTGFLSGIGAGSLGGAPLSVSRIEIRGDKVYYLPPLPVAPAGTAFLRNGLLMGDLKKDRFEPSVQLALAFRRGEVKRSVDLPVDDPRLVRYLAGEPITLAGHEASGGSGWHLLTVAGYPLAFGKITGNVLKNKYPSGWRTC